MVHFITKNDFDIRASLGIVKDYMKEEADNSVMPPSNYNLLLEMFENDSVLSTAVDTTVDVGSAEGFRFEGKNKQALTKASEMFNHELDFDMVVQNLMYCMIIYGDAFMEIRKTAGKPTELHILETTEMKIQYDKHGTVLGYLQVTKDNLKIPFTPEEVIHFKFKTIGSRVYSYTPFKPIMRDYTTKKYASNYLSKIFSNFPPRLMYVLKTANKEQTKAFIENLKRAKNSPHKDLVGWGEIKTEQTGVFDFSQGLVEILNHLRTEVLMVTKVPPIWIGIPDNSNRSNSEAQIRSFETRIRSIQKKISSEINKNLLPNLGFNRKSVQFKFNPFSLLEEETIMGIAEKMKTIGVDDDSILEYITMKGIRLRHEAKIETPDPAKMFGAGTGGEEKGSTNRGADKNGKGRETKLNANGASKKGKEKTKKQDKQIRSTIKKDYWSYDAIEE